MTHEGKKMERAAMRIGKQEMHTLLIVLSFCGILALAAPAFAQVSFDLHFGAPPPVEVVVAPPPAPMEVVEAPPPVVVEPVPEVVEAPAPDVIWVPGYYVFDYQVHRYQWTSGAWQRPPHEGSTWVAPQYDRAGGRYLAGHWGDHDAARGYATQNGNAIMRGSASNGYATSRATASNGYATSRATASNGYATSRGTSTANGNTTTRGYATTNGYATSRAATPNGYATTRATAPNGYATSRGTSTANGYTTTRGYATTNGYTTARGTAAMNGQAVAQSRGISARPGSQTAIRGQAGGHGAVQGQASGSARGQAAQSSGRSAQ